MTDKYEIIYSPAAWNDLTSIYSYISNVLLSDISAKNQVDRIRKHIRNLDMFPKKHKVVEWEPWKSMKTHQMPVDNFIVFYSVSDEERTVTITRIVYGGQNIENIKE